MCAACGSRIADTKTSHFWQRDPGCPILSFILPPQQPRFCSVSGISYNPWNKKSWLKRYEPQECPMPFWHPLGSQIVLFVLCVFLPRKFVFWSTFTDLHKSTHILGILWNFGSPVLMSAQHAKSPPTMTSFWEHWQTQSRVCQPFGDIIVDPETLLVNWQKHSKHFLRMAPMSKTNLDQTITYVWTSCWLVNLQTWTRQQLQHEHIHIQYIYICMYVCIYIYILFKCHIYYCYYCCS